MPRRKTNPHLIPGDIAQYERPEWRPLMEVVGSENRQRLDEVRFDDGSQFFGDMATVDDFEAPEHAPQAAAA